MGYRQLSEQERYVIGRLFRQHRSVRFIASLLERAPSTISRELRRNATRHDGAYRPEKAHQYAVARRRRSRRNNRYGPRDWSPIARALRRLWSPAQIVGRYRLTGRPVMSKETIYRYIRRDRRAAGQLWLNLRIVSKFGRKRRGSPATRGRLLGKRHISERPPEVEMRLQQGQVHFEGYQRPGHHALAAEERQDDDVVAREHRAQLAHPGAAKGGDRGCQQQRSGTALPGFGCHVDRKYPTTRR